jgi:3-isopropylmalate/(R)-2-methylmalate dehydratase large subunit
MAHSPRTLCDKVWESHIVAQESGAPAILYIDLHLLHEVTSPQAFDGLKARGLSVRRPDLTLATLDHSTPTRHLSLTLLDEASATQLRRLSDNSRRHGIRLFDLDSSQRGIVHVIGPELGATQPGMTIVCGDSHTATHGAFGALAFGIGTSEVEHVLASQCLLQSRPKTFQVSFEGRLSPCVTAKDMILALIARIGTAGGTGSVIEYAGPAVRALDMEERMTLCNMSIEAGARAGMVAPDEVTFEYLAGRPYAPKQVAWDEAVERWRNLPSDPEAAFDRALSLDVSGLQPMITYGTNPGMAIPINDPIPDPAHEPDSARRSAQEQALRYMDLVPGRPLAGHRVDVVFLGSCTNSRITDLRAAASMIKGRRVAEGVRLLVVPGSEAIRRQAEAEGLDRVFKEGGGEWRYSGCSMCIAMNGDELQPGQYAVSTSNRNFVGRQGKGSRTFLASPLTAAATALTGQVTDPRRL